jgi:hypothetical protein
MERNQPRLFPRPDILTAQPALWRTFGLLHRMCCVSPSMETGIENCHPKDAAAMTSN